MTKIDIMQVTQKGNMTNSSSRFSPNERGFSIVELIVVGVVISIMVAVAVPRTVRQLQFYRLDRSTAAVSSKLTEARINAIKRNRTVWLRIDKTARTSQIRTTDSGGATVNVGYADNFPQGTDLDAADSVEVAFDSMGRYASGPQLVTMVETNLGRREDINISPAGKIKIGSMY
jgi:Tfp pilus assembly protein FimT